MIARNKGARGSCQKENRSTNKTTDVTIYKTNSYKLKGINSNKSPIKTECLTTNSRYSNAPSSSKLQGENQRLKEQVSEYKQMLGTRRCCSQELKEEIIYQLKQDSITTNINVKTQVDDQRSLNYIIQQQQLQISDLKRKLFCAEQKGNENQQFHEKEVLYFKNQVIQQQGTISSLQEVIHQLKFKQQLQNTKY